MPRRKKQTRSLLDPLTENFARRLSSADARLRRKTVKYGFWVLTLFFCYSTMFGTYSIPRIIRLELQKESLQEANKKVLCELIDNSHIRSMLEFDAGYIEQIARTKYHMVRPNETIYYYRGH